MAKRAKREVDLSTEERIKEAARKVFTQKGYAATRTRDIAEEAGINLALLNYYFRSKERLFHEVMAEKLQQFFGIMFPVINDPESTLEVKLTQIAANYTDMLLSNPDLPIFVLSEIRNHEGGFMTKLPIRKLITESVLVKQMAERNAYVAPLHFIVSFLGMIIFPFIARPVFQVSGVVVEQNFSKMMEERKRQIPLWINAMLDA